MTQPLDVSLSHVSLLVADLERESNFYTQVLGLQILTRTADSLTLGKHELPLLTLVAGKELKAAQSGDAGLYHFAILFESRGALARTLHTVLLKRPDLYTGSADHLVSEAFYLNDPEGNGIELYFDRERTLWNWAGGQVQMASIYLDPEEYLAKNVTLEEPNASVTLGHFHLKVGDIATAKHFYVDVLGFEVTASYPGALFISVKGYHHHLGLNTWESAGAQLRSQTLGLHAIEFRVPDEALLTQIAASLRAAKIPVTHTTGTLTCADPWGNHIRMVTHA